MELNDKYRPKSFNEVLGQDATIESLKKLIETKGGLPPCLLLIGDSGIGKTTIARICASEVGCINPQTGLIEINGAVTTGIDDMREVLDQLEYAPLGKSKNRVIILDEAHRLSPNAWDSLLKPTEEPPPNVHWIFCSTDPTKIRPAIKTRCTPYELKKVPVAQIKNHLVHICELEGYKTDNKILTLTAMKAEGSPRRALKLLEMVHSIESVDKAQEIIKSIGTDDSKSPTIAMCQILVRKGSWMEAVAAIKDTQEDNETIRIITTNFFNKVVLSAKSEETAKYPLMVLHAFSKPCNPSDKLAPILLALASILIAD